eukprot:Rmarinus@m.6497
MTVTLPADVDQEGGDVHTPAKRGAASLMDPEVLHQLIQDDNDGVLLIDVRPELMYDMERIKSAVNLQVDSECQDVEIISRKPGFDWLSKLVKGTPHALRRFSNRRKRHTILYDQTTSALTVSSKSLSLFVRCLEQEGNMQLSVLSGGFSRYTSLFPQDVLTCEGSNSQKLFRKKLKKRLGKHYATFLRLGILDPPPDSGPDMVVPGVFLGSEKDAANMDVLRQHSITHVLNCASELEPHFPNSGLFYYHCQMRDHSGADIVSHFVRCFDFIDESLKNDGRVLLHCFMGVSRSVALCLGWLVARRSYSLAAAVEVVKEKRPSMSPNKGFMRQLAQWEAETTQLPSTMPTWLTLKPPKTRCTRRCLFGESPPSMSSAAASLSTSAPAAGGAAMAAAMEMREREMGFAVGSPQSAYSLTDTNDAEFDDWCSEASTDTGRPDTPTSIATSFDPADRGYTPTASPPATPLSSSPATDRVFLPGTGGPYSFSLAQSPKRGVPIPMRVSVSISQVSPSTPTTPTTSVTPYLPRSTALPLVSASTPTSMSLAIPPAPHTPSALALSSPVGHPGYRSRGSSGRVVRCESESPDVCPSDLCSDVVDRFVALALSPSSPPSSPPSGEGMSILSSVHKPIGSSQGALLQTPPPSQRKPPPVVEDSQIMPASDDGTCQKK